MRTVARRLRPLAALLALAVLSTLGSRAEPVAPAPAPPEAQDADAAKRRDLAMAEILRSEDRRQVDDSLRAAVKDPSPEVRARALVALGRIAAAGARERIEPALKDPGAEVRLEAAFALGLLREAGAVPALAAAASDASPLVRAAVAEALGRIRTREASGTIVTLLSDPDVRVRADAALAAWQLPDAGPVVSPLLTASESPDAALRLAAAYALARMSSAAVTPATPGASPARTSPADVRRIRDRLRTLVAAPEPEMRMQVARGLSTPANAAEVSTLAALVKDPDPRVRVATVRALGFPGAPIEPLFARGLKDSDPRVAYAATEGLGRIGGPAAGEMLRNGIDRTKNPWLLEAAMTAIAQAAPDLAPQAVLKLSRSQTPGVRAAAARALIGRSEPEAMAVARALLKDPSPVVQVAAIPALSPSLEKLGGELEGAAGSADPVVRSAVADAAADRLAHPNATPEQRDDALALVEKVWEKSAADTLPDARLSALDAAGKAGKDPRARAILVRGLADPERNVRLRAIDRLRSVFGEDASAKAGPASERPIEEYATILAWAKTPRAAVVTVAREGFDPGRFTIRLDASAAPLAAWNFAQLAAKGFYDGNVVHRVVPNFVVQDGDPRGDGYGGPGYAIRDEISHLRFVAGAVGMASDGKDTAGSQWFVTVSSQPHLDGRYTVFGQVVQNLGGVVGQILPGDRIVSIRVYDGDGSEPLPPL
jgi:cyclophilin family peptidyl-prolyl cis-trans isomerase/HEAT repeat protein